MPLLKLPFRPGVNKEVPPYAAEGAWVSSDKVRFRFGLPEKIGGWQPIGTNRFLGVGRSITPWVTLGGRRLTGVGTNLKFYVENGAQYYDITPVDRTATVVNPVSTQAASEVVTWSQPAHGAKVGDFFILPNPVLVGGLTLQGEYQVVSVVDSDTFTFDAGTPAAATATGGGSVDIQYLVPSGPALQEALLGWGAGSWGSGSWGIGDQSFVALRIWLAAVYGQDLLFAPRGSQIYHWDGNQTFDVRGVPISSQVGASEVPLAVNGLLVSDQSRFVLAFGTNELFQTTLDPMLIRWSAQENYLDWNPQATNQAGGIRLSKGSEIIAYVQARQEVLVWTDQALYGMQYVGPPYVWTAQLLADSATIISPNAAVSTPVGVFWMGVGKFYAYDGRVQSLPCTLLKDVFNALDTSQQLQVFGALNEEFNEVWWFYPSAGSSAPNRYVVYNYVERLWYEGSMTRTAWVDRNAVYSNPVAIADGILVEHEVGSDDTTTSPPTPIEAFIESAPIDLEDGDSYMFAYRALPDFSFEGSTSATPQLTVTMTPYKNSGSGTHASIGGSLAQPVTRSVVFPVEQYTGQVFIRLRGRQASVRIASDQLGVKWQLGALRVDLRKDGRAG